MDQRTQAELYRRGLTARWLTVAEAILWADAQITAQATPPIEIIELSLARQRRPEDAACELLPLTQGIPENSLLVETVEWMRAAVDRDERRAEPVAIDLHSMALRGLFPAHADLAEVYSVAYEFDPDDAAWATNRHEAVVYLRETLTKLASALARAA